VGSKLSIRAVDANHGVATWERTLIQVWHGPGTPLALANVNEVARAFIAEVRSGPITSLYIVEPSSPPPSDVARRELATFSRELVPKMALAVIVAEGGGFRAALVRGVGIALTTLMPHRVPFKFVNEIEEALTLLAPHLSRSAGGVDGLREALGELRLAIQGAGAAVVKPSKPLR
jgi:hypothetical protein